MGFTVLQGLVRLLDTDGRIIAIERIKVYRQDVLVKSGNMVGDGVGSGDKKKLLEKQKAGKKRHINNQQYHEFMVYFLPILSRYIQFSSSCRVPGMALYAPRSANDDSKLDPSTKTKNQVKNLHSDASEF
jgi:hypothetical protein